MAATKFKVLKIKGRKSLVVRWHDGDRWVQKSAATTRRREAERRAPKIMAEHAAAKQLESECDWFDFVKVYKQQHLDRLSSDYRATFTSAANKFRASQQVDTIGGVAQRHLAAFTAELHSAGHPPATIASYLKHLRAALNWATDNGYRSTRLELKIPKNKRGVRKMRGRPLTGEEFDRLVAAAPDDYLGLLNSMWLIGLRLSEALIFSWDDPTSIHVDALDGRTPCYVCPADCHKAGVDMRVPLTPDAVAWLRGTPAGQRTGLVGGVSHSTDHAGRIISAAGKSILVGADRHATAHDLRRSFGTRWAQRVKSSVLKVLMRHASITTTDTYYIELTAASIATELRALGDVLGDTPKSEAKEESLEDSQK